MGFWNYFRIILGMTILIMASIFSIIIWHKKIDSETTWIYGIYILIQIIAFLFVLIGLEQFWLAHY